MSYDDRSRKTQAPVALVDLGDTLCECSHAVREGLEKLRQPTDNEADEWLLPLPPHLESRRRQIMSQPGFWLKLPPSDRGFDLLHQLLDEGFRVYVLTKGPHDSPQVWSDKVAWCRLHLPTIPVIVTDDKSRIHGHVLVDDWLPYVDDWQRQWPTGLAVVPAQPWNSSAELAPRRIRADGTNKTAVAAALRKCREAALCAGRPNDVTQ